MDTGRESNTGWRLDLDSIDLVKVLADFDEGVIIADHRGRIIFCNRTMGKIDDLAYKLLFHSDNTLAAVKKREGGSCLAGGNRESEGHPDGLDCHGVSTPVPIVMGDGTFKGLNAYKKDMEQ